MVLLSDFRKLTLFLAVGLPSLLIAIAINWLLVVRYNWVVPLAYAVALAIQVTLNFFSCRIFVFEQRNKTNIWVQFTQFMSGILVFRAIDWVVYTILVSGFGIYFLFVQILNALVFSVLKFKFSQKVME